jgi:TetR/AcrR family transcriptional repressor of nem operon
VSRPENAQPGRRLTPRGAATRARIVAAAVELMYVKGVNATTLDDVRAASNTSKSQLYNHFPDKEELVRAVVAARAAQVLERERGDLQRLKSFRGLVRWRDALVQRNALRNGAYGGSAAYAGQRGTQAGCRPGGACHGSDGRLARRVPSRRDRA